MSAALKLLPARTAIAPAERNPVKVYLASLAPSGRRSMAARLRNVAVLMGYTDPRDVQWPQMRFEHVAAIKSRLVAKGQAPATVNATLAALRGVARAAWNLGQLAGEDFQRIAAVKSVRGSRLPAGRALSPGEVAALFEACARDASAAGARDAAILALLLGAGLRRSECAALDLSDYNPEDHSVKVRGKGDKERLAYLESGADQALSDWLIVRGAWEGPLVCAVRKGGTVEERRVSDQAIYNVLVKRGSEARVAAFSPHDLRRTFVSDLLDAGADLAATQRLVGHASPVTTGKYDRRGEMAKRKAAALVHLPYRPRF